MVSALPVAWWLRLFTTWQRKEKPPPRWPSLSVIYCGARQSKTPPEMPLLSASQLPHQNLDFSKSTWWKSQNHKRTCHCLSFIFKEQQRNCAFYFWTFDAQQNEHYPYLLTSGWVYRRQKFLWLTTHLQTGPTEKSVFSLEPKSSGGSNSVCVLSRRAHVQLSDSKRCWLSTKSSVLLFDADFRCVVCRAVHLCKKYNSAKKLKWCAPARIWKGANGNDLAKSAKGAAVTVPSLTATSHVENCMTVL